MKQYDIVISAEEARSLVDDIYVFLAMQTGVNFVAEQPKEALEKRFGSDLEQRVASCLANQCADKLRLCHNIKLIFRAYQIITC